MKDFKIITDSNCDIPVETVEKLGIRVLPISFTFDGENYYRDGIDITHEEFYEKLTQSAQIPKTTQVTPIEYLDAYNEEYDNGNDNLLVITISSRGSGMHSNAVMMANEIMQERGGNITVVDSMGFSCITGAGVIKAVKMKNEGKSKEEIVEFLNDFFTTVHAYFLVGDLEHLKKGGRINTATLVLANMLDIKPILTIKDGIVVQKDKIRGSKRILKKLIENIEDDGYELDGKSVIAASAGNKEKFEELKEELTKLFPNVKVNRCSIGPIVGCHGGPDLCGVIFSDKYDLDDFEE